MFSTRKRPLLLVPDRLLALRLSLNTPVVSTPDLPAGPARAAIAVHREGGRTCFTVAVRSLTNGASVLYELEGEDPNDASGIAVALDATLSFGESMGFLFDDELVTSRSEPVLRAALARLREIVAPPAPDETAPLLDGLGAADEILLDEALETPAAPDGARAQPAPAPPPEPRPAPAPGSSPSKAPGKAQREAAVPARAPAPATPRTKSLTKFRHLAAAADGPPEKTAPPGVRRPPAGEATGAGVTARPARTAPGGGALLGRIEPVRLRASDAPASPSALLRLLASF